MEYEEFVALTVLAAAVGCDRKTLKSKVSFPARLASDVEILSSSEVNSCVSSITPLTTMADSLYKSSYAAFFVALADVEQTYLVTNPILAPHARYYVREMRIKAYQQLLESYRSLTLERMSRSFGVSEAFIDRDLSRFIASGRIACTIDKVSGVITTDKLSSQNKTAIYEQFLKQGDLLLSGMLQSRNIAKANPPRHAQAPPRCRIDASRGTVEVVAIVDCDGRSLYIIL